ncbi:MAG: cytochrome c3 family protein [Betaproteobacteria bacterium]
MKILLITQTRNKKGQAARTEQPLVVDVLRIGRGTDCKLYLPDPRVALHHAQIRHGADGSNYIEAEAGSFSVDGSLNRPGKLLPDQRILLGPYELVILPLQQDYDLVLSVELLDPLREGVEEVRSNVQAGLQTTWLSKRLFSWTAAMLILAAFLVWPVMHATTDENRGAALKADVAPDASWDVGPLASAHASFGRDCHKCHQLPFIQVKNQACEDCHKTIGWHFPLKTAEARAIHAAVFPETRCASCHRDHKGQNGLVRTDATLCTDCHRDLKTRHAKTGIPDIGEFTRDHPPFMLSMLQPGRSGDAAIVRVPQDTKVRENSGLKFPHETHLSKKGVRSPAGTVTLECANCHVRDEAGIRFKPVTMKDHCQQCHSLEFEPKVTTRQVPHGNVADVQTTLNEFYAQAALADTPIDVVVEAGIRRPGERLAETKRQAALTWAADKADRIAHDLFEVRVCFLCHQITAVPAVDNRPATWQVAPVAITRHWLPKSRFPHSQHDTFECAKCHQVSASKSSADVAIPDLKKCRECHGGNQPTRDKARGTCETCHGFHTGSHKAGVPAIVPGSTRPRPQTSQGNAANPATQVSADAPSGGAAK